MSADKMVKSFRASLVKSEIKTIVRDKMEREFVRLVLKDTPPVSAFRKALEISELSEDAVTELTEEFMPLVEAKELGI